jgi:Zn-dependent protease with chaperone function
MPAIRRYWIGFAVYAAAMGVYLYLTRGNGVPEAYRGTPADPATFMNGEELRISESYPAWRNWLFFLLSPLEWGLYGVILFSGWGKRLYNRLEGLRGPSLLRFTLYALVVQAVAYFGCLPLRFVGYRMSRYYDISTQGMGGWLRDKLVEFAVGAIPLALGLALAMWLIRRGGRWWLKLWLISVPFIAFMMVVQPVFIDPLYNQYTRLSDPVLEAHILAMADEADVPAERVYEANMSAKTNAYNAYVNGIGPTLRIVVWDTLYRLDENEILPIVAHEIGHYVLHHLEWSTLGLIGSSLVMLYLGQWLYRYAYRRWGKSWGLRSLGDPAAAAALLLLVSVLGFASLPFSNLVSRQAERAADAYALKLAHTPEGVVSMNQKLVTSTYDDVYSPLLVRLFRDTHPSAMERIRDADQFARSFGN